jgi:hypothetical protein
MRNARRDAEGDEMMWCAVLEQSGLHQNWEPATFSGSHRCLLTEVMVLWGVLVFSPRALPATLLILYLSLLLPTSSFAIVLGFIFPNLFNVSFRPAPMFASIHPDLM